MRPLLIALRRCWGPWLVPPLLALEVLNVQDKILGQNAPEVPLTALDAANGVLIPLNPLLAGVVCAESLALFRVSRASLVWTLPDSGWRAVATHAGATTVWVIATHLVVVAGVVAYVVVGDPASVPSLWPMAPALVSMMAYAAIGVAAARLAPWKITPPLLPVGLYLAGLFLSGSLPLLVDLGGATEELVLLHHRPEVLAAQVGWLLVVALCVGALALTPLRSGYAGLVGRGIVIVVVLAVAGAAVNNLGSVRFETVDNPQWVCAGQDPEVCVIPAYAEQLPDLRPRVTRITKRLDVLGFTTPSRFELGRVGHPVPGRKVGGITGADADLRNQASNVVQSLICPENGRASRPSLRTFRRVERIAAWVTETIRNPDDIGTSDERRLRARAEKAVEKLAKCA